LQYSTVAKVLGLDRKKLQDWYKNHLSDFKSPSVQEALHKNDIPLPPKLQTTEEQKVDVPILKPENLGEQMAVDEKYINGKFYTLLTNAKTGKIALMASTTKSELLSQAGSLLGDKRFDVKILTRDLASYYDWFGRTNFMNAAHVADKFHVLKHAFDALQDLRIYHRQKLLSKKREAFEKYKKLKKDKPKLRFTYNENKLANGETHRQLLARSRHLLFKYPNQWTQNQSERANLLFKNYPDLKLSYKFIIDFRNWYSADNVIGKELDKKARFDKLQMINNQLNKWMQRVNLADITEISNFKSLVERHRGEITNYFITGASNAIAEANNSIINAFIRNNRGTRNLDFFYFRLSQFLS
jgi:hypothetical protein